MFDTSFELLHTYALFGLTEMEKKGRGGKLGDWIFFIRKTNEYVREMEGKESEGSYRSYLEKQISPTMERFGSKNSSIFPPLMLHPLLVSKHT